MADLSSKISEFLFDKKWKRDVFCTGMILLGTYSLGTGAVYLIEHRAPAGEYIQRSNRQYYLDMYSVLIGYLSVKIGYDGRRGKLPKGILVKE